MLIFLDILIQHRMRFVVVWRSVVISQPAQLKSEHNSLVIEQEQIARVPFEDIAVIILDHRDITITHSVLSACADNGIGLYSTGDNHLPNGLLLPFLQHSRATRMQRLQLNLDKPTAKRAWARIVHAKISNQAKCMRLLNVGNVERLKSYVRRIQSGDKANLEAQASAYYFPQLFGKGFSRSQTIWVNSALNYGYAIMRGACARAVVAHGLLPSFGLFHRSEQNSFNLADDLIEPFRPIVDFYVASLPRRLDSDKLIPSDKVGLIGLLNVDVVMPRGSMSVLSAIEQASESIARLFEGSNELTLEFPVLLDLKQHQYEM